MAPVIVRNCRKFIYERMETHFCMVSNRWIFANILVLFDHLWCGQKTPRTENEEEESMFALVWTNLTRQQYPIEENMVYGWFLFSTNAGKFWSTSVQGAVTILWGDATGKHWTQNHQNVRLPLAWWCLWQIRFHDNKIRKKWVKTYDIHLANEPSSRVRTQKSCYPKILIEWDWLCWHVASVGTRRVDPQAMRKWSGGESPEHLQGPCGESPWSCSIWDVFLNVGIY